MLLGNVFVPLGTLPLVFFTGVVCPLISFVNGNKDNMSLRQNLFCSLVSLSASVSGDCCLSRLAKCICSALLSFFLGVPHVRRHIDLVYIVFAVSTISGTDIFGTSGVTLSFCRALPTSFPKVLNFLITLRLLAINSLKLVEPHNGFRKRRHDSSREVPLWSCFSFVATTISSLSWSDEFSSSLSYSMCQRSLRRSVLVQCLSSERV